MQTELPAKTVFTLGYQGSDGHHLNRIFDANLVYDAPPQPAPQPQANPSLYIKPEPIRTTTL